MGSALVARDGRVKGAQEWRIWLSPDGGVDNANFRPAQ
jgi:hypothetical protein